LFLVPLEVLDGVGVKQGAGLVGWDTLRASSAMGWMVPVSLLASMMVTRVGASGVFFAGVFFAGVFSAGG